MSETQRSVHISATLSVSRCVVCQWFIGARARTSGLDTSTEIRQSPTITNIAGNQLRLFLNSERRIQKGVVHDQSAVTYPGQISTAGYTAIEFANALTACTQASATAKTNK